MVSMPVVQIRQQYAKLGIEREPGQLEMHRPPSLLEMKTTPPELEMESPPGIQTIDQNPARSALGIGPNSDWLSRVADEAKRIAMEGIARIVDEGNREWAIHKGNFNVISDLAWEHTFDDFKINYEGPFSPSNVNIDYVPQPVKINYTPGSIDMHYQWSPVEMNYTPAVISIYVAQKPSLEFIPPQIDIKA